MGLRENSVLQLCGNQLWLRLVPTSPPRPTRPSPHLTLPPHWYQEQPWSALCPCTQSLQLSSGSQSHVVADPPVGASLPTHFISAAVMWEIKVHSQVQEDLAGHKNGHSNDAVIVLLLGMDDGMAVLLTLACFGMLVASLAIAQCHPCNSLRFSTCILCAAAFQQMTKSARLLLFHILLVSG